MFKTLETKELKAVNGGWCIFQGAHNLNFWTQPQPAAPAPAPSVGGAVLGAAVGAMR